MTTSATRIMQGSTIFVDKSEPCSGCSKRSCWAIERCLHGLFPPWALRPHRMLWNIGNALLSATRPPDKSRSSALLRLSQRGRCCCGAHVREWEPVCEIEGTGSRQDGCLCIEGGRGGAGLMMSKDLPLYRDGRCDKCDRDDWNKLMPNTDPPVYLCSRCRQTPTTEAAP